MSEDNVLMFPGTQGPLQYKEEEALGSEVDMDVLFDSARSMDLKNVIIAGTTKNNDIYFASSSGDPKEILWELERAKHLLMLTYFAQTAQFAEEEGEY